MTENLDVWKLLAGLGIFMFGMFLMEESVKNLAGRSFKKFIREYTRGRIRSIASGAFVTAILQSSSAVSLMVLAFVGAGIMAMENAIGVILGSNIGTTATAWIVAFFGFKVNIEAYSLPLIGIGGLGLIFLGQSVRYSNISKLLVGFGFLFMGLDYMKTSVEQLTQTFDITSLPDYGILPYALVGLMLTAIMQSSSATIAIVLTALNAEVIGFNHAAAMVVGANVGTTVTVILGTIGSTQIKKRVALSHLTFNGVTAIVGLLLLPVMVWFIELFLRTGNNDTVMGIALFHTLFNVIGVLLFLPFMGILAKWLLRVYPDRTKRLTKHIHQVSPDVSDAAIASLRNEIVQLIASVLQFNRAALSIKVDSEFENQFELKPIKKDAPITEHYEQLKLLQAEIFTFSSKVMSFELDEEETVRANSLLHASRMTMYAAKTIKDVAHNFDEFEDSENEFLNTTTAAFRKHLNKLYGKLAELILMENHSQIGASLGKILKKMRKADAEFVTALTRSSSQQVIQELEISNLLVMNRALIQSARQLILAIKEVMLSEEEEALFERLIDVELEVDDSDAY
ncbi:MAG: Na/Pi symporter [Flavobacteriales bacterium]|nr:Na/Pi symporter [Flavobacteriales bacterium]